MVFVRLLQFYGQDAVQKTGKSVHRFLQPVSTPLLLH